MQVKKDYIKKNILKSAEKEFLSKGYANANLRNVASNACCSLSNIYNYFDSKDVLFCEMLKPVTEELVHIFDKITDIDLREEAVMKSMAWEMCIVEHIISYIDKNSARLNVLFIQSEGSSLERFKDILIDKYSLSWKNYSQLIKERTGVELSSAFLRDVCMLHVNAVIEALKGGLSKADMHIYGDEILKFTYYGIESFLRMKT